jgi:hypothetical protein
MEIVRSNVFETNSSSTHSFILDESGDEILDTLELNEDKNVVLTGGIFGCEWAKYNDALTKANYVLTYLICSLHPSKDYNKRRTMFNRVIKRQTGCKGIIDNIPEGYRSIGIDSESLPLSGRLFQSEDKLRDFIFNKRWWLYLGNDNSYVPSAFYEECMPSTNVIKLPDLKVNGEFIPGVTSNEYYCRLFKTGMLSYDAAAAVDSTIGGVGDVLKVIKVNDGHPVEVVTFSEDCNEIDELNSWVESNSNNSIIIPYDVSLEDGMIVVYCDEYYYVPKRLKYDCDKKLLLKYETKDIQTDR